jgi:UDP-N-acetylglucosamine diphosphorylase/glucosamine-1-phosphate N-acetyltransferase
MNLVLFDDETRQNLLPFTYTRPVAEIRVGVLTIREKWEKYLNVRSSFLTQLFLREKFPFKPETNNFYVNGSVLPNTSLINEIKNLDNETALFKKGVLIAFRSAKGQDIKSAEDFQPLQKIETTAEFDRIVFNWDIFTLNEKAITDDITLITAGRKSVPISPTNTVIDPQNVFIEKGAIVESSFLNGSTGKIYISQDAEVMEGSMIRGPFSLGEHSQVKMGAKIYGATSIGPYCKVAGEVSNSVMFGFSNKGHDGFLGNSVIGEWCNLGAGTNNSNLKNNYSKVKLWNYADEDFINTGLQFCGLIMGDHSKCSINTMFNTGTVVGVSANIFGNGFPPKFISSFAWGGTEGFTTYRLDDAFDVAQRVFERRGKNFDMKEQNIFRHLFDLTTKYRAW